MLMLSIVFSLVSKGYGQVFQTKIASAEVAKGAVFEVAFSLNSDEAMRFTPPRFQGLKVVSGPYENNSVMMVNGKVSQEKSWVYELSADQIGQYTIGSASVICGGRTLTTQPVTIKVSEPKNLSKVPAGANAKYFVNSELDRTTAYPGQQVTWKLRIYTQVDFDGFDIIDLPELEGFYTRDKRRFDTRVEQVNIKGKRYLVKTLHEAAIFPQNVGNFTIGPAQLRLLIPEAGPFGMPIPRPVVVQTSPVELKVQELPAEAPESFTGAVGKYNWEISADSLDISTDGAVTVKLIFKGNGDSRRFTPPKIKLADGLEVFDPRVLEEEEYESLTEIQHTKSYEYVILPKMPGQYAFQPEFTYYAPDSNKYITLHVAKPDTIRVVAGKNYNPLSDANPDSLDVAQYPGSGNKGGDKGFSWAWLLLLLPVLGLGLFWMLRKNRRQWVLTTGGSGGAIATGSGVKQDFTERTQRSKTSEIKPVVPAPQAVSNKETSATDTQSQLSKLQEAAQAGQTRHFYDVLFKALEDTLMQKLGLSKSQLNAETLLKSMASRQYPASLTQNVLSLWQSCEQALFAGQAHAGQVEHTLRLAQTTFEALSRA